MDYENVLGEHKFPTYEQLKTGLLRLIDEGKISREDASRLLPELRESEDEKIRKWLVDYFSSIKDTVWIHRNTITCEQILAWLEKQKESLPIPEMCKENAGSFTDEDEDRTINGCLLAANAERRCKRASEELLEELGLADYTKFFYEQGVEKGKKEREKQKEQKPAWSEEDNRMIGRIRGIIERYAFTQSAVDVNGELCEKEYVEMDAWLKSLRPSWKPSEEQMKALGASIVFHKNDPNTDLLRSLYDDLQKIR